MKAVILAAGKGTRLRPFTHTLPKPLLPAANIPLIAYNLEALKGSVDEVIVVVGHLKEEFKRTIGEKYGDIKITYVEQKSQEGTAHALTNTKEHIDGNFILLMGDDVYSKEDISGIIKQGTSMAAKEVKDVTKFGAIVHENGNVVDVIEKPSNPPSNLASIGMLNLPKEIFTEIENIGKSKRDEYELTDAIKLLTKTTDVKVFEASNWNPVSNLWNLLDVNSAVISNIKKKSPKVEGAYVGENVVIGEGTEIKHGAYIEGPAIIGKNCTIGPNCYIRSNVSIGNKCRIGNAVEIKNSIVMDHTNISHLSFIGDSILGRHVNIGAGTITANLRHDNKTVKIVIDGKIWDSGRRKFGAFIGDHSKTGINTSLLPGRCMDPNTKTQAGEIVKNNILNPSYE